MSGRPSRRRQEVKHYSDDNPSTFAVKKKPPPAAAAAGRPGRKRGPGRPRNVVPSTAVSTVTATAAAAATNHDATTTTASLHTTSAARSPQTSPQNQQRIGPPRKLRILPTPRQPPTDECLAHAVQWTPVGGGSSSSSSSLHHSSSNIQQHYRRHWEAPPPRPQWQRMPPPYASRPATDRNGRPCRLDNSVRSPVLATAWAAPAVIGDAAGYVNVYPTTTTTNSNSLPHHTIVTGAARREAQQKFVPHRKSIVYRHAVNAVDANIVADAGDNNSNCNIVALATASELQVYNQGALVYSVPLVEQPDADDSSNNNTPPLEAIRIGRGRRRQYAVLHLPRPQWQLTVTTETKNVSNTNDTAAAALYLVEPVGDGAARSDPGGPWATATTNANATTTNNGDGNMEFQADDEGDNNNTTTTTTRDKTNGEQQQATGGRTAARVTAIRPYGGNWVMGSSSSNDDKSPLPSIAIHAVAWDSDDTAVAVLVVDASTAYLCRLALPDGKILAAVELPQQCRFVTDSTIHMTPQHIYVCTSRGISCHVRYGATGETTTTAPNGKDDATTTTTTSTKALEHVCTYGETVGLHGKTVAWRSCQLVPRPADDAGVERHSSKKQAWCRHENILNRQPPTSAAAATATDMVLVGVPLFDRGPEELWSNLYVWDVRVPTQPEHVIPTPKGGLLGARIQNTAYGWTIQCATAEFGVCWELAPTVQSDFAGCMYPVGYRVVTDNLDFIEEEDALDIPVEAVIDKLPPKDESDIRKIVREKIKEIHEQTVVPKDPEDADVDVLGGCNDEDDSEPVVIVSREFLHMPESQEDEDASEKPPSQTPGAFLMGYPQCTEESLREPTGPVADAAPPPVVVKKPRRSRLTIEALLQSSVDSGLRTLLLQQQTQWSLGRGSSIMVDAPKSDKQVVENASQEEKELAMELLLLSPSTAKPESTEALPDSLQLPNTRVDNGSTSALVASPKVGSVTPSDCTDTCSPPSAKQVPLKRLSSIPCGACRGRMVRHVCGKREKPVDYEEIARLEREKKAAEEAEKLKQRVAKRRAAEARRREAKKRKKLEEERQQEKLLQRQREEELRRQEEFQRQRALEQSRAPPAKPTPIQMWDAAPAPPPQQMAHHTIPSFSTIKADPIQDTDYTGAAAFGGDQAQQHFSHVQNFSPENQVSYAQAIPEKATHNFRIPTPVNDPTPSRMPPTANETDALAALAGLAGLQTEVPTPGPAANPANANTEGSYVYGGSDERKAAVLAHYNGGADSINGVKPESTLVNGDDKPAAPGRKDERSNSYEASVPASSGGQVVEREDTQPASTQSMNSLDLFSAAVEKSEKSPLAKEAPRQVSTQSTTSLGLFSAAVETSEQPKEAPLTRDLPNQASSQSTNPLDLFSAAAEKSQQAQEPRPTNIQTTNPLELFSEVAEESEQSKISPSAQEVTKQAYVQMTALPGERAKQAEQPIASPKEVNTQQSNVPLVAKDESQAASTLTTNSPELFPALKGNTEQPVGARGAAEMSKVASTQSTNPLDLFSAASEKSEQPQDPQSKNQAPQTASTKNGLGLFSAAVEKSPTLKKPATANGTTFDASSERVRSALDVFSTAAEIAGRLEADSGSSAMASENQQSPEEPAAATQSAPDAPTTASTNPLDVFASAAVEMTKQQVQATQKP